MSGTGGRPLWEPEEYPHERGFRTLAIDPTNSRVILDLRNLMGMIFDFDPDQPLSYDQWVVQQARLESESVEKAIADGRHPNLNFCYMCRYIKVLVPTNEMLSSSAGFEWSRKPFFLPFGNWTQLNLRRHCAICRLILSLIGMDLEGHHLHPRLAAMDYEIQGVSLHLDEVQATGERVLRVEYGMRKVGDLRVLTQSNYTTALRHGWEMKERGTSFTEVVDDIANQKSATGERVDFDLLKSWLDECVSNHGINCSGNHYRGERYEQDVPLILIDVVDNCLVASTTAEKYFTLSYVWGKVDMLLTMISNYKSRCNKDGLPVNFPNTIADAMALVRALGERYLWVDALCIVQDDDEHKMRDITRMDVIYLRAFATIVALAGGDADAGLPGLRPGTRLPQQIETLVLDAGSEHLELSPASGVEKSDRQQKEQVTVHLVATPRPLHLALDIALWNTRGWTFQERLLSRRCIYFTRQYAYFQCVAGKDQVRSECGVLRVQAREPGWGDEDFNIPITTSLDNPLTEIHGQELDKLPQELNFLKTFRVYTRLVEKYTLRKLTYEADILNAFMGIFGALNTSFESEIICGLPVSALDLALLWAPAAEIPKRKKAGGKEPSSGIRPGSQLGRALPTNRGTLQVVWGPPDIVPFDQTVDRRFPSWSWAGWVGPVQYRLFADMSPDEPFPMSLIEEFTVNLDENKPQTVPGRGVPRHATPRNARDTPNHGNLVGVEAGLANLNVNTPATNDEKPIPSPSLPNVLQFLAPTLPLTAFSISMGREYISVQGHIHSHSNQAVRHILDKNGKRCGLWWEQKGWMYVGRGTSPVAESKIMFVGISQHEDTSTARKGPGRAEGEIKIFDHSVYPSVGKGSGLVNALVVDLDMGHEYGERITVARVHVQAWEKAGPVVKMVRLA